jgi:alkanesulfonate monooxygenase SsuD/methylene tetrahydromethanopterin reductase-like flavin-dependent oxidoreductase (luciferase family)
VRLGIGIPSSGALGNPDFINRVIDASEELGFESAWFADHPAVPAYAVAAGHLDAAFYEPIVASAWSLSRTQRLLVGTDILVIPYRQPALVASMVASLASMSADRFVLGAGIGYLRGEFDVLGAGDYRRRAETTDNYLRQIRAIWLSGEHAPVSRAAPIWVGGNSHRAVVSAALLGDGWQPLAPNPAEYRENRGRILALRRDAGLDGKFTFSASISMMLLKDSVAGWPSLRPGGSGEFSYRRDWPLTQSGRPRFVGDLDDVGGDLDELSAAGAEHIVIRLISRDADDYIGALNSLAGLSSQDPAARG